MPLPPLRPFLPCAGVNSIYANMVRWKDHVRKPTAEEDAMVQAIAMVRGSDVQSRQMHSAKAAQPSALCERAWQ